MAAPVMRDGETTGEYAMRLIQWHKSVLLKAAPKSEYIRVRRGRCIRINRNFNFR